MAYHSFMFMIYVWLIGAVLLAVAAKLLKEFVRVNGAASWFLLVLLGPLPAFAGSPLASLVLLDPLAALPCAGMTIVVALLWVHFLLPAALPDFQVTTWSTSALFALLLGISVYGAGFLAEEFPRGWLLGAEMPDMHDRKSTMPELDLGI